MKRGTLNVVLLVLLAGSLALNWLGGPETARRNFEYFPNMARSARFNGFAPNPNFADGKTLREPVPGTMPRGFTAIHFTASKEDALRAGEELASPFQVSDTRSLDRGAQVFANFCTPCHGAGATGNGPVAMRGYPAPPSLLADHARVLKDGQMFHILTFGQNNMPSYAGQISPDDRWRAILYVRSLQKPAAATAPAATQGAASAASAATAPGQAATATGGQP